MALSERDPNVSGRNSRVSDYSSSGKTPHKQRPPASTDMFSNAAPGVLSMLRTTTDTGDIGSLSFNTGDLGRRLPKVPRTTHARRHHATHISDGSLRTDFSHAPSSISNHRNSRVQPWDNPSLGHRASSTSLQTTRTMPSYLTEPTSIATAAGQMRYGPYNPSPAPSVDGHASSMTHDNYPNSLHTKRSISSLKSYGGGPRIPNRGPYLYPSRLKRPGYRSVSPALSDMSSGPPSVSHGRHAPRPPLASYHSEQSYGHGPPIRHPQMSPQRSTYNYFPQPPLPYEHAYHPNRNPPMGHLPPHLMPRHPPPPHHHHNQYHYNTQPPRTFTPRMDSMPSSSEPGSSATPSTQPPTPRDTTAYDTHVEPPFIEPAMSDFQDETSERALHAQYLDYASCEPQAFELEADAPAVHELEASPTPQAQGFVQRIKALLDEKNGTTQASGAERAVDPSRSSPSSSIKHHLVAELPGSPVLITKTSPQPAGDQSRRLWITRGVVTAGLTPSEQGTLSTGRTLSSPLASQTSPSTSRVPVPLPRPSSEYPADETEIGADGQVLYCRSFSSTHTTSTVTLTGFSHITGMDCAVNIDIPDGIVANESSTDVLGADNQAIATSYGGIPISPMRPDEIASRDSLVSPLSTQTLHLLGNPVAEPSVVAATRTRTPVEDDSGRKNDASPLNSGTAIVCVRPPPADSNTVDDATATSDIVTDVAVRFSLPRRSLADRPQVVQVPITTDAAPTQAKFELHKDVFELPETISPRESISTGDTIPPLQIKKIARALVGQSGNDGADLSNFIRRSFPRRQSVLAHDAGVESPDFHSNAESARFSSANGAPGRLPRLQEESREDLSGGTPRPSVYQFPMPRIAGAKDNKSLLRPVADSSKSDKSTAHTSGNPLSENTKLPSLNFSSIDLIDQLNDALDTRSSKSMEISRTKHPNSIICPSPIRPASTEALRQRYTSFFRKPEEFHVPTPVDESEAFSANLLSGGGSEEQTDFSMEHPHGTFTANATKRQSRHCGRPLSPEMLLGVVSDVNRLSIPSVAGLTERLSEWLPSIKRLRLNSAVATDEAVSNTIDEIHHLGERPNTLMSVRTSGGLRQMAAAADKIVTNGTHDSAALEMHTRLMKDLPALPDITENSFPDTSPEKRSASCMGLRSSAEMNQEPRAALMRTLSDPASTSNEQKKSSRTLFLDFLSDKATNGSTQSSNGLTKDQKFPWSAQHSKTTGQNTKSVLLHDSISSEQLRQTARASAAISSMEITDLSLTLPSRSSESDLVPTHTVTADTMTGQVTRKMSKRSVLGSLSRKMRLGNACKPEGEDTQSSGTLGPGRPHPVGDRYPSTGLSAPQALNMDEVRSFFSDDSSQHDGNGHRRGSLRKHLTQLRSRLPPSILVTRVSSSLSSETNAILREHAHPSQAPVRSQSRGLDHLQEQVDPNEGPEDIYERAAESVAGLQTRPVTGMSPMEVKVKRVTDKLRYIIAKGGMLLRSISHRGRHADQQNNTGGILQRDAERHRDEWLDDASVYSGT